MNIYNRNLDKRTYSQPQIERVKLDNDISLVLDSTPPTGPGDEFVIAPEYFNNDPFKLNHA